MYEIVKENLKTITGWDGAGVQYLSSVQEVPQKEKGVKTNKLYNSTSM